MVVLLDNPIRSYAWGSPTVLAQLFGWAPSGRPEAELWVGAHPVSPSTVRGDGRTLDRYVADDPVGTLGSVVVDRFGATLPYLLKVLAIERPLSIQVHPTAAQAVQGFAREEADGVPRDSPYRSYVDRGPKPELVVAVTPFDALVGFAGAADVAGRLIDAGHPELASAAEVVRTGGLATVVARWLTAPEDDLADAVSALAAAAARRAARSPWSVLDRLAREYPGDRGLLLAAAMRQVRLGPGEALAVPAGTVHCYLSGVAVEAQASSDNTIRAGLTAKHVDRAEVLRVARLDHDPVAKVQPHVTSGFEVYPGPPDAPGFRLARIRLSASGVGLDGFPGPRLMLVLDGRAWLRGGRDTELTVDRGAAAFIGAAESAVAVGGDGVALMLAPAAEAAPPATPTGPC